MFHTSKVSGNHTGLSEWVGELCGIGAAARLHASAHRTQIESSHRAQSDHPSRLGLAHGRSSCRGRQAEPVEGHRGRQGWHRTRHRVSCWKMRKTIFNHRSEDENIALCLICLFTHTHTQSKAKRFTLFSIFRLVILPFPLSRLRLSFHL